MLLDPLAQDLYNEFCRIPVIDVHSHLNPRQPAARSFDDLLSYHYYLELALATGMDRAMCGPGVLPEDRVRALFYHLVDFFPNTVAYQWLGEIARAFLGYQGERLTFADCTALCQAAERLMSRPDWEARVMEASQIDKVFVTLEFDDPLTGFDTRRYVPCLRADDLVFRLDQPEVRRRLTEASGIEVHDAGRFHSALSTRFEHFQRHGARAVNLVVPPNFAPRIASEGDLSRSLTVLAGRGPLAAEEGYEAEQRTCIHGAFRAVLENCRTFQMPLQLMIGISYRALHLGTPPPWHLFGPLPALLEYAELFEAYPGVTFCIAALGSGSHEELANFSRLFANVFTLGHGGDSSNVPTALERAARARLQTNPQTKQIGYYSGMDRLEFALPQFNMYRRVLAEVLATDFVRPRLYTLWQAVQLGRLLLRDNARRIYDV